VHSHRRASAAALQGVWHRHNAQRNARSEAGRLWRPTAGGVGVGRPSAACSACNRPHIHVWQRPQRVDQHGLLLHKLLVVCGQGIDRLREIEGHTKGEGRWDKEGGRPWDGGTEGRVFKCSSVRGVGTGQRQEWVRVE